jgi:hypothetical protein
VEDAATRDLEHAREAASTAAFRIVVAFCGLGVVDLVSAMGGCVLTVAVSPPAVDVTGPVSAVATGWGLGNVGLIVVASSVKLAVVASIHRRRLVPAQPLMLWVLAGLFGIGARIGSAIVGSAHVMWISRAFDVKTLAAWSIGASVAGFVHQFLDCVLLVVILSLAALGLQRDRRQPDGQATYRSPGLR